MRISRFAAVSTCAALAAYLAASAVAASSPVLKTLSDERTLSRWGTPNDHAPIRTSPTPTGRVIARLKLDTEDGLPNVYLALQQLTDSTGNVWIKVRIPMRPNGRKGWVRQGDLGPLQRVSTLLVIDRRTLRATLYRRGRRVFRAPVGVGKRGTPTPAGHFWIRDRLHNLNGNPLYGPIAFGTSAYASISDWPRGGVVGIHGTNQPQLIPGRPSHGCVRMRNRDIVRLSHLMPIGTPVEIR